MQNHIGLTMTALAVAMLTSGTASAYEATAFEKAELALMSPQLRKQVEDRLTGEQTVRGILETMLLNKISLQFATNRVVAADFDRGVVVVEGKKDEFKVFPFDVVTLEIKK